MKKVLVLVLALAMLLGCTAMVEGNLIGYTCMDGSNPFFVRWKPRSARSWRPMATNGSPLTRRTAMKRRLPRSRT